MNAGAVPEGDADALAFQLWALVHGLVSLRANKPGVPWPDTAKLARRRPPPAVSLSAPASPAPGKARTGLHPVAVPEVSGR